MPYTPYQRTDNGVSTVAGGAGGLGTPLNPSDTTLRLPTGDGAKYPATPPFMLSIGGSELVKATLRSSDTVTISRAQEGTSATTWPVGATVELVETAGTLANMENELVASGLGVYNVRSPSYGAVADGVTDDTTAINAAIAAGVAAGGYCVIYLPPSSAGYGVSAPLAPLSAPGMFLVGLRSSATWLKPLASFSGAQIVSLTANFCGVRDLTIAYSSNINQAASGNPAANGIQVTAARSCHIADVELRGINGWAIQSTGTSSLSCFDLHVDRVHALHCAKGGHTVADTAQGFGGQQWWTDCNFEVIDSDEAMLIEDINDIWLTNFGASVGSGATTGRAIHVKGACSEIHITQPDVGAVAGITPTQPVVLIESGTNGSPVEVEWEGGVSQGGTTPLSITSGATLKFASATFKKGNGDGAQVSGLTGTATFEQCTFKTNGAGGSTAYDLNITASSNLVRVRDCMLETTVGAGANTVTACVNDTSHKGYFEGCHFLGAASASQVFASGGTPQIVRHCPGYNPRGNITAPTITASPFSSNTSQHDVTIIFTAINTLTAFKIGGTSVGVLPVAGVPYHVPARQSLELDYSGAAPTWQWYGD